MLPHLETNILKLIEMSNSGKSIRFLYSGGADSAILLCLLDKYVKVPVNLYTVDISPYYMNAARAMHKQYFSKHQHNIIPCPADIEVMAPVIGEYMHSIGFDYSKDVLVTGQTKNPPYDIGGRPPVRLTEAELEAKPWIVAPFIHMTKRETTALAETYAPEDLLEMTQSCCADADHCGVCFPCLERKWAFGYHGYDMTGRRE